MPVTSPVSVPSSPDFERANIEYVKMDAVADSPFTGHRQVTSHQGEFWQGELVLPPLNRQEMGPWKAFLMKIRGRKHTFKVSDPHAESPEGSASGTPESAGPGNAPYVRLDGTNDYVEISDISAYDITSAITVEIYVKPDQTGALQVVFSKVADSNRDEDWELGIDANDNPYFLIGDGSENRVTGSTALNESEPYHLAGTFDGTTIKVFVDGQEDGSKTISSTTITNDSNNVRIGGRPDGADWLEGDVNDARIWKTDRSQSEIENNLTDRLSGSETDLVGYWKLNDNSGTTADDETTNDNDGTLKNDAKWIATDEDRLIIRGWDENQSGVLKEGDNIEVNNRLKTVIKDHDTTGAGTSKTEVRPKFRQAISGGNTIITDTPEGEFKLDTNRVGWEEEPPLLHKGITIPIREHF